MCGFVGKFHPGHTVEVPVGLIEAMGHRGPDATGAFVAPGVHLRHARLRIQDISDAANQPMVSPTGRFVLVFNGEIYNHASLRAALPGIQWKTTSDTETLLYWLMEKGEAGLDALNGCFALAFIDLESDELLLARDPMGIKPLHVRHLPDGATWFASEHRGLEHVPVSAAGIDHYLSYGFLPDAGYDAAHTYHWPTLPFSAPQSSSNLEAALEKAVERRLLSDVPLGSFLSGGLDSSLIAAMAVKHQSGLKTFALGFSSGGLLDERSDARRVAEHIGSEHHELALSESDMLDALDDWIGDLDQPFGDASALAVWHLSRFARKHVTVALSGDGADELFAGYRRHRAFHLAQQLPGWKRSLLRSSVVSFLASVIGTNRESRVGLQMHQLVKLRDMLRSPVDTWYERLSRFVPTEAIHQVRNNASAPAAVAFIDSLEGFLKRDQQFILPLDMLTKVDRMSMAHGLEVRVPFLDPEVVAFSRACTAEELMINGTGKQPLRKVARKWLPQTVLDKPKHGFEMPIQSWLTGPLAAQVYELLHPDRFGPTEGWNRKGIQELLRQFARKPDVTSAHLIWNLYVLKRWEMLRQS